MAVWALPEHDRVDGQQRVEPAPGLVDRLRDEVGREREGLRRPLDMGIADLGRRHGARVEPGVDHRLDPAAHRQLVDLVDRPDVAGTRPAGERHLVNGRPVRVDPRHVPPAQVRELGQGPDAAQVAPPAAPDRQRRPPVAVARQGPVDVVLEPLAEAPVADVGRVPVHRVVGGQQVVLAGGRGDVPARLAPVDERRAAAPAVRVGVDIGEAPDQQPRRLQPVVDVVVGLPDIVPGQPAHGVGEAAVGADRVEGGQAVLPADLAVDLAEGGRQVHQAGALLGGHVRRRDHPPAVGPRGRVQIREGTLVVQPDQGGAGDPQRDPGRRPLPHHRVDQVIGHHDPVDDRVDEVGVDRHAGVRQQGPRRRRPHRQPLGVADDVDQGVDDAQPHVGRLVLLVAVHVGLPQLVARQSRPAAGAVRHDLEVLVQQTLVEELLEVPPDRLDVRRVQRPVRRVHVDPVADARRQAGELVDVGVHRLAAQPGELGDAHLRLDLLLARDPEPLLHLHLDREPVGVPAGPAGHVRPVHGAEAAEEVLVDPGPGVVEPRHPVGRRRALVEDPRRCALALGDGPLEDAVLGPTGQLGLLEGDEVDVGGNG